MLHSGWQKSPVLAQQQMHHRACLQQLRKWGVGWHMDMHCFPWAASQAWNTQIRMAYGGLAGGKQNGWVEGRAQHLGPALRLDPKPCPQPGWPNCELFRVLPAKLLAEFRVALLELLGNWNAHLWRLTAPIGSSGHLDMEKDLSIFFGNWDQSVFFFILCYGHVYVLTMDPEYSPWMAHPIFLV